MDEDDYVVYEGNNRSLNILRNCDSWYSRSNKILTYDELFARAKKWNEKHCRPPYDEQKVSEIVKQSMGWVDENNVSSLNLIQTSAKIEENLSCKYTLSDYILKGWTTNSTSNSYETYTAAQYSNFVLDGPQQ